MVTVNCSASDSLSGIDTTSYLLDGVPQSASFQVTTDLEHTVAYSATDNAGNISSGSLAVNLDLTDPTIDSFVINNGSATTHMITVRLDITASDALSGVANVRMSNNNVDWSAWQAFTQPLYWAIPAIDLHTFTVYIEVQDAAGNASTFASDDIYLELYPLAPHSASYRICADTINVAGSTGITSTSFTLTSSLGQPFSTGATGFTGTSFTSQVGFLGNLGGCLPITRPVFGYNIPRWVIASGGALRSSATYTVGDTLGEPIASGATTMSSASYLLSSGFWGNPSPSSPPPAATVTTITSDSPDPSEAGQTVTVQFTVTSGSGTPTGLVTVTDSLSAESCSATIATGQCNLLLPNPGSSTLTATYPGDSSYIGSSDTESHTVGVIGADTIGTYNPSTGNFLLRNTNDAGAADLNFLFAADITDGIPLSGDWDSDGVDTIGVFSPSLGEFRLRNSNDAGPADITLSHPKLIGTQPLVGDWDGDGTDTIGVYYPNGKVFLRNTNTIGQPDVNFKFGNGGLIPLAGDWDGDGVDTIGTFDPVAGEFQLRNSNSAGPADIILSHNILIGAAPIVGDWDGDGDDTVGIYVNGKVFMRNTNSIGQPDIKFDYGGAGLLPVTGDWDGL